MTLEGHGLDWITALASLTALVTAVAAFLTVLEMRRQRITLYRPDLAVLSAPLFVYAGTYSNLGNGVHCSPRRYDLPADAPKALPSASLHLDCFNLGLGAAKDVQVKWSFDIAEIARILDRLAKPHGMSVECRSNSLVLLDAEHEPRVGIWTRGLPMQTLPYVLPVQVHADPQHIEVPFEYIKGVALYASYYVEPYRSLEPVQSPLPPPSSTPPSGDAAIVRLLESGPIHMHPQLDGSLRYFPPATASLSYRDIGGNAHVRTFYIAPTFSDIQQLPRQADHIQEMGGGELRVTTHKPARTKKTPSPRRWVEVPEPPREA
jgi:hypothetical protein